MSSLILLEICWWSLYIVVFDKVSFNNYHTYGQIHKALQIQQTPLSYIEAASYTLWYAMTSKYLFEG